MAAIEIKPVREVMKVIRPFVESVGGRCRVAPGSGAHPKLIIEYNGQERQTQLSTSPRTSGMAIKYKLSDVKRLLREMGPT
jgi:hypothetical protein